MTRAVWGRHAHFLFKCELLAGNSQSGRACSGACILTLPLSWTSLGSLFAVKIALKSVISLCYTCLGDLLKGETKGQAGCFQGQTKVFLLWPTLQLQFLSPVLARSFHLLCILNCPTCSFDFLLLLVGRSGFFGLLIDTQVTCT